MPESFDPYDDSVAWVADTGPFIACGRRQDNKYTALERFARRNELTFTITSRVYDELGGAPDRSTPGQTPTNSAIDAGRVTGADEPDYTNKRPSKVKAQIRSLTVTSPAPPCSRYVFEDEWTSSVPTWIRESRQTTIPATFVRSVANTSH